MKCSCQILTLILAILSIFVSPSLPASTNYCAKSLAHHFIRAKIGILGQARLDATTTAQVEFNTSEFNSGWVFNRARQHTRSIGFNLQYTIVNLGSIDTMTNGHMHTLDFPLEGRLDNTESILFYNVTPTISVSSNALKNPELIDSDGLRLSAGMVYKKNLSAQRAWLFGFRSDYRFGSSKTYPVIGVCLHPDRDWSLQLALPDFSILKRFSRGLSLALFAKPAGNQWHVFSKDMTRNSNFIYSAIAIGLSVQWNISTSLNAGLSIENQSNRRFNYVLNDYTSVEVKAEPSTGMMLTGEVLF